MTNHLTTAVTGADSKSANATDPSHPDYDPLLDKNAGANAPNTSPYPLYEVRVASDIRAYGELMVNAAHPDHIKRLVTAKAVAEHASYDALGDSLDLNHPLNIYVSEVWDEDIEVQHRVCDEFDWDVPDGPWQQPTQIEHDLCDHIFRLHALVQVLVRSCDITELVGRDDYERLKLAPAAAMATVVQTLGDGALKRSAQALQATRDSESPAAEEATT